MVINDLKLIEMAKNRDLFSNVTYYRDYAEIVSLFYFSSTCV